jgi:para-nitrobenzyl esterase
MNVTIFGESAGGMSVCGHLVAAESRGLFHRGIIESGPCSIIRTSLADAEAQGARFAQALGCETGDVPACMRAATESAVLAALPPPAAIIGTGPDVGDWGPIIDGHVFTAPWIDAITAGDVADVPIIAGWNHDEGTIFILLQQMAGAAPVTEANYRDTVARLVGDAYADMIVARYPPSDFGGDARLAAARALGDGGLICPARATAIALRAHVPVHSYLFAYPDARFLLSSDFPLGAFHQSEVQFVFGRPPGGSFPDGGDALHDAMSAYWARFASNDGDPNDASAVAWPAFDDGTRLVLDRTIATSVDDYEETCAFWAAIPLM